VALLLIVEDSWLSRRVICKILKEKGYEILEAASGPEALEILQSKSPDCILLDLLMPEMEGREVLKILREQGSKIPVIVITADIQKTTRSECLELGAIAVINKIPDSEVLTGWVEKAISREHLENQP
jgi:two-component system, response regulator, stage 0 sporulation protein F